MPNGWPQRNLSSTDRKDQSSAPSRPPRRRVPHQPGGSWTQPPQRPCLAAWHPGQGRVRARRLFRNRKPENAPTAPMAITVAPENGALRKNRNSSSGLTRRGSWASSVPTATSAKASRPSVVGDVQPACGASMIASVRLASATITSSWPTASTGRGQGALDSGTKRAVRPIAARPIWMLIQKMERQPTVSMSTPADDRAGPLPWNRTASAGLRAPGHKRRSCAEGPTTTRVDPCGSTAARCWRS